MLVIRSALLAVLAVGLAFGCAGRNAPPDRGASSKKHTVRGLVRNEWTRAPVKDVEVILLDAETEKARVRTGPDGRFELRGRGKHLHLRTIAADFAEATALLPEPERPVTLDVEAGTTIVGRVVSAETRAAVAGATVSCLRGLARESGSATTDTFGRFRLEHCGRTITVRADGYAFSTASWGGVTSGDELSTTMVLERGFPVTGRVVGEDGKPIANADILAFHAKINPFLGATAWTKSGPDGTFALPHLTASDRRLVAFLPQGPVGIEEVTIDRPTDVEITIPPAASFGGRATTSDGRPAAGARLVLGWYLYDKVVSQHEGLRARILEERGIPADRGRRTVTAGPDGTFRADGLWASKLFVRVASAEYGRATVVDAHTGVDVAVVLTSGGAMAGTFAGMLVDTAGNPVLADGDVSMAPRGENGAGSAGWVEEGAIRGGRFRIEAIKPGTWFMSTHFPGREAYTGTETVIIKPAEVTNVAWVTDRNGSVRGRIVDQNDGSPVANACVSADYLAPSDFTRKPAKLGYRGSVPCVGTDAKGRFRLSGVRGNVTLHVYRRSEDRRWPYQDRDIELAVPFGEEIDARDIALRYSAE